MPIIYNLTMSSYQAAQHNHTGMFEQSVSGNSTEEPSEEGNVRLDGDDNIPRENITAAERFHEEFDAALNGQVVKCAVCSRKRSSAVSTMYILIYIFFCQSEFSSHND